MPNFVNKRSVPGSKTVGALSNSHRRILTLPIPTKRRHQSTACTCPPLKTTSYHRRFIPLPLFIETSMAELFVSMADDAGDKRLHIVMFPWLAFGHMLPFLELSKSMARRGHRISFISTPRNIQRLPKLPTEISHLIDLVALALPKVEGLREAAEATVDLPPEEVPYLKKAFDGLERPFADFIKGAASPKPDWVVQDFAHHWLPAVGAEHGIPCIFYVAIPAAAQGVFGLAWDSSRRPLSPEAFLAPPPWIPFPSKVAYRYHELLKLMKTAELPNPSGVSDIHRYKGSIEGSRALAVRSCNELESDYLTVLGDLLNKPVLPVGLLPPSAGERNESANESEAAIMRWLDEQGSRSVIYVALGTEAGVTVELVQKLALGLEAAKLPFVWGLRRPFSMPEDAELLPEGFEDRTKGFGLVVKNWAPQVKILAHESVGGFLTHCGWSSIIEGLHSGHPLVLLPLELDQGLNARLMEEKGMGVEVERNDDGSFTGDSVSKAVRQVMADDEGEKYRKKAGEMKDALANGARQEKYVDDFAEYLATHRNNIDG